MVKQHFEQILPPLLRKAVLTLPEFESAEEIRLRAGMIPMVVAEKWHKLPLSPSTPRDLQQVLENASQGSIHTVLESLRHGYIPLPGGHRLGVCGSGVMKNGDLVQLRNINSLCIRIAKEKKGIGDAVIPKLMIDGRLADTLILSPPGIGKTTLLRDIVRSISNGYHGISPMRISLADERGEVAACFNGVPQLDVGKHTDVMSSLPKGEAAVMMLRGMSPQVLALDEITAPKDAAAVSSCFGCGVTVLATAHAAALEDLEKRPVYKEIQHIFKKAILISRRDNVRKYEIREVNGF